MNKLLYLQIKKCIHMKTNYDTEQLHVGFVFFFFFP